MSGQKSVPCEAAITLSDLQWPVVRSSRVRKLIQQTAHLPLATSMIGTYGDSLTAG